ncbi:LssY C-terminal domain-containing protein [Hyphomicrobium sp.]|uniref:LssY C-terminal domain-containing protein n=1 Tax=Hyphomicrobium sp. TaxID=82 RepID=UPI001DC7A21D|nr:LssY C-terminal domain-containing protein [Hyphomicrobium sp.]MBY0561605.1 LssY C-terminal domain-containing protein [Hyphomicrobium sp.]
MRLAIRTLQRIAIFGLGVLSVWLIVDVFELVDRRLPWILAVSATYVIGAYLILPRAVRMGLKILQRQHVPSFTITGDGLPGDPVNLALAGTAAQLRAAFAATGWVEADKLDIASSWRMARAFVLNTSYPTAPFSTLYLFGRGQDVGFQKAIDNSPRKRHHVRFWAQNLKNGETDWNSAAFWLNDERPADDEHVLWVGAGTKDTGFSLTRMTFQMTHATDSDTNAERNFIVEELSKRGVIGNVTNYKTGDELVTKHVNHYVTDGDVAVAELAAPTN